MERFIVWLRQDLRLEDNPALYEASKKGVIIPIYIFDDTHPKQFTMGSASLYWLKHLLKSLNQDCNHLLRVYKGDPIIILPKIIEEFNAKGIFWNRCYEPWRIQRDRKIKEMLTTFQVESFNGSLLWEPWQILKSDQTPYRVFTPFYRKGCLPSEHQPRNPLPKVNPKSFLEKQPFENNKPIEITMTVDWGEQLISQWDIGEKGGHQRLNHFIEEGLSDYKVGRDFPGGNHTSRISVDLHWGTLSPHQVRYAVMNHPPSEHKNLDHYLSELGWREFSYYLLYHFPYLPTDNLQKKFDFFPWIEDAATLKKWQMGQTGYPIVDAGMREMYATGYMHNRLRMIVGSFLVKNLLQHWHAGEAWFWDCLVDADLASNSASWQWIAGCGADAAPYFRIFNPITQGEKFDAQGIYTKKWVPELKNLPNQYLFKPWEAPTDVLSNANITLGKTYPKPIVAVAESRARALQAFEKLKGI